MRNTTATQINHRQAFDAVLNLRDLTGTGSLEDLIHVFDTGDPIWALEVAVIRMDASPVRDQAAAIVRCLPGAGCDY